MAAVGGGGGVRGEQRVAGVGWTRVVVFYHFHQNKSVVRFCLMASCTSDRTHKHKQCADRDAVCLLCGEGSFRCFRAPPPPTTPLLPQPTHINNTNEGKKAKKRDNQLVTLMNRIQVDQ